MGSVQQMLTPVLHSGLSLDSVLEPLNAALKTKLGLWTYCYLCVRSMSVEYKLIFCLPRQRSKNKLE